MFTDQLKNIVVLQSVMRGCLARKKFKCLQEEKESKVINSKVKRDVRNNISQPRLCHVSSRSPYLYILSVIARPWLLLHTTFMQHRMGNNLLLNPALDGNYSITMCLIINKELLKMFVLLI